MDDFKKIMYGVIVGFGLLVVGWVSFLTLNACGLDIKCQRAKSLVVTVRTPIPTLLPATLPAPPAAGGPGAFDKCAVRALDLIGAWAAAGNPETDSFPFTDLNGDPCEGTFEADIDTLFSESNVWFPASISCTLCHNTTFEEGTGGLDLTTYAGIMAGSGRASPSVERGRNLFGNGDWTTSILLKMLTRVEDIPFGHPPLVYSPLNLVVYAGAHLAVAETTAVP